MNFKKKVFADKNSIQNKFEYVFVSDFFVEQYVGGAELTSEALIQSAPGGVAKVLSSEIKQQTIEELSDKLWIFGNISNINPNLFGQIISKLNYVILEYDYKFCKYRSIEKHEISEGTPCNCQQSQHGILIGNFFNAAKAVFWMSEAQKNRYIERFPHLASEKSTVLSSVFSKADLQYISSLKSSLKDDKWIILGSNSWIKGFNKAQEFCKNSGKQFEVVWNIPYRDVLQKLSRSRGFVYLPEGGDTCPRMVIEAKLLGCELEINENVQHASESWFNSSVDEIFDYLQSSHDRFWKSVSNISRKNATIGSYITTRNCESQGYPWKECIQSLLGFSDEVCVVDGGSTDGTWEKLQELVANDSRIKIKQVVRNWDDENFSLYDGLQKAEARKMCTSNFLWQSDVDEIVHEQDYHKIKTIVKAFPQEVQILALPVIEYWGRQGKVRIDVNPWKWRLSRNNPRITHGIPKEHRKDVAGLTKSKGSDGTDYIFEDTLESVPFATFYPYEIDRIRDAALGGNASSVQEYENWCNTVLVNIPGVQHYSWYNIERKIKTYKNYWSRHWTELFAGDRSDVSENNMFFSKPWREVSDSDIRSLSDELEQKMGGWIFHRPVDLSKPTPWVTVQKMHPLVVSGWLARGGKNESEM